VPRSARSVGLRRRKQLFPIDRDVSAVSLLVRLALLYIASGDAPAPADEAAVGLVRGLRRAASVAPLRPHTRQEEE
jgi:hypothetical protein